MRNRQIVVLVTLLIVGTFCISACNTRAINTLGPSPLAANVSVLSTPTIETPMSFPTPSPGLAVVGGKIVEVLSQEAPPESTLYLGEILTLDSGRPVVRLERGTAPYAIPAPSGEFLFQDVRPGQYGLVLYTPEFSFLVDDPDGAGSLIFDVLPDQVLDLGQIEVTLP